MAVLVCLTSASLEYYSQSTDVIRKTKLTKDMQAPGGVL